MIALGAIILAIALSGWATSVKLYVGQEEAIVAYRFAIAKEVLQPQLKCTKKQKNMVSITFGDQLGWVCVPGS